MEDRNKGSRKPTYGSPSDPQEDEKTSVADLRKKLQERIREGGPVRGIVKDYKRRKSGLPCLTPRDVARYAGEMKIKKREEMEARRKRDIRRHSYPPYKPPRRRGAINKALLNQQAYPWLFESSEKALAKIRETLEELTYDIPNCKIESKTTEVKYLEVKGLTPAEAVALLEELENADMDVVYVYSYRDDDNNELMGLAFADIQTTQQRS